MRTTYTKAIAATLATMLSMVLPASAQLEVGTVAAVQGALQIERAGTWQVAAVGVPVAVGDRLKTGDSDRVRIVFRDDSIVDLGFDSELVVDSQVFEPARSRFETLLRMPAGTLRALVSQFYGEAEAVYEIETPTAVIAVRGTEFLVRYYATAEVTEVVGIAGEVNVAGRLAVIGAGVEVGPQQVTQVRKGGFPTTTERLVDARFRQYLETVEIVGTGRRDGLNVLHPLIAGRLLGPQDLAERVTGVESERRAGPRGTLPDRLSPDVYTNTQPLLDYRNTPPGQVPPGGVTVTY